MEAVRPPPPPSASKKQSALITRDDSAPPSYFDVIDSAPEPPSHPVQIPSTTSPSLPTVIEDQNRRPSLHQQQQDEQESIRYIMTRGISESWARIALRRCNGNVEEAMRFCLENGALEDHTQTSNRPVSKKKKGNVVSRTLGVLKLSTANGKIEKNPPREEKQSEVLLDSPPSYGTVTSIPHNASPEANEPPPYEEIISNESKPTPSNPTVPEIPKTPSVPISSEAATENLPPRPLPRKISETKPGEVSPNLSSVESSAKLPSPPPLLSQTKRNSWQGWKHNSTSSDISPIYAQVSLDSNSEEASIGDVVVRELRNRYDADEDENLEEESEQMPENESDTVVTIESENQIESRQIVKDPESEDEIPLVDDSKSETEKSISTTSISQDIHIEVEDPTTTTESLETTPPAQVTQISPTPIVQSDSRRSIISFDDVVSSDDEVHAQSDDTSTATFDEDRHYALSELMYDAAETLLDRDEDIPISTINQIIPRNDDIIPKRSSSVPLSTVQQSDNGSVSNLDRLTNLIQTDFRTTTSFDSHSDQLPPRPENSAKHRRNHTSDGVMEVRTPTSVVRQPSQGVELPPSPTIPPDSISSPRSPQTQSRSPSSIQVPAQQIRSPTAISTAVESVPNSYISGSQTRTERPISTRIDRPSNTSQENLQASRSEPPSTRIDRQSPTTAVAAPVSNPQENTQNSRSERPLSTRPDRPHAPPSRSSSLQSQTLPAQLPSQISSNSPSTLNRPVSFSRLPRATAVVDDTMDDDTIHGEAYVPVALDPSAVGSAVSDVYLHDESGRLYMAVAAPLTTIDDETRPHTSVQASFVEETNQNRGFFSYARSRLYGDEQIQRRRREIEGGVKRRIFLPFDIEEREGKFYPVLYLTQPKLGQNNGPQYNRPTVLRMTPSVSRNLSLRHAEVNTPPLWDGGDDRKECSICLHSAGLLYKIHHCRNCGHYVCNNCSKKDWPASMLPKTYVPDKETVIRVCDNCAFLQEGFVDALRSGDLNRSMVFYLTGNVNLHCPMTIYKSEEYPIHAAIQGGNIHLVRWLIEDRRCSLRKSENEPLKTVDGLTPLAMAAYYGHREIMRYLVQTQNCRVTEIKDPTIMLRGLHAALEAPGELPEGELQGGFFRSKRSIPGELEPIEQRSGPTAAPVPAQLATGNRNIAQIPTTVAEAAPSVSINEASSRPKLAQGKRRVINPQSIQQTRRTLAESSHIMASSSPARDLPGGGNTPVRDQPEILDIQRAITTPYTDDDVSVMTNDMMSQYPRFSSSASTSGSPDRVNRQDGHRRSRSLHSSASTALVMNNIPPTSMSADSVERPPNINRALSNDITPRSVGRFEVNSVDLSHAAFPGSPSIDEDNESVDTVQMATHHVLDPLEANRMSMRASHQSMQRLEAEEREAQNVLSRATSSNPRRR